GAAYARGIAAAGGHVVAVDVDADGLERLSGQIAAADGRGSIRVADVADWASAHDVVRDCLAEHGRLDGLVNNAGVFAMARAGAESEATVRRMLEVNVLGAVAWGDAAIAAMRAQGRGVLVNVTSGEQMGRAETAVYGATKAAIATLTYAWAAELADVGIRVNAISPNAQTRMAEVLERFRGVPSGQNAGIAPEANVPLLLYLLSDLSAELTGQVLRSYGPELMLTTHPALAEPVLRDTAWTPERIAEAVTARLRPHLAPLGVRRARIVYLD
ncbi:short-chain dehydrogenase, partial [Micromonospora chalcea]